MSAFSPSHVLVLVSCVFHTVSKKNYPKTYAYDLCWSIFGVINSSILSLRKKWFESEVVVYAVFCSIWNIGLIICGMVFKMIYAE